jgi:hypothetical protein
MATLPDDDYEVYFADHDAVIECGACDPEYGPAESWPAWTDEARFVPSEQDLEDMAEYSAWLDRLEEMHPRIGDDDIQACGLPVG